MDERAHKLCSKYEDIVCARSNYYFMWCTSYVVLHLAHSPEQDFCSVECFCPMFELLTAEAQKVLKNDLGVGDAKLSWEYPRELDHGDLALNSALQLAKQLGKKPREIAQILADALAACEGVAKTDVAGPGFVNVWLTPGLLLQSLGEVKSSHGPKKKRKGEQPVIVEYSQPNIAKPLGIHHILSTVIGQVITNLYRHEGYPTVAINHLGDWGTQFGKMSVAMRKWGEKPVKECTLSDFLALYVRFHEEVEKDPSLDDEAREEFRKLEQGDKTLTAFWKQVVKTTMKEVEAVYKRLGVSFDHVHGESFYQDKMAPILEEGMAKKVFIEGEKGALIAVFPEESNLPPAIVLKGDKSTIYHTRDLATIRYRIDEWKPQSILYVVDVAQTLYFQQLFAMVKQLGWELPQLEHVVIGRMRFADRSMSTRKGNILRLQEVLDEAVARAQKIIEDRGDSIQTDDPAVLAEMMGTGAVVYGILSQNRKMDLVFDWDKMLSFEGNSAPYIQYTHARACSVLRKAGVEKVQYPTGIGALSDAERTLARTLLLYPSTLEEARSTHMPHKLANYLYQLCQDFNAFYNNEPIAQAEEPARSFRLAVTSHVIDALRVGSAILTLRLPERM